MPQPRPSHTYLHRCLLQYMTIPYLWEKLLVLFRFKGILLLLILIDICILFRLYFLRMETKCISICSLEDFLDPLSISRACGWGRRWGPGALAAEPASTLVAVSTLATHQKVTENLWNCLCSDARNVDLIGLESDLDIGISKNLPSRFPFGAVSRISVLYRAREAEAQGSGRGYVRHH